MDVSYFSSNSYHLHQNLQLQLFCINFSFPAFTDNQYIPKNFPKQEHVFFFFFGCRDNKWKYDTVDLNFLFEAFLVYKNDSYDIRTNIRFRMILVPEQQLSGGKRKTKRKKKKKDWL